MGPVVCGIRLYHTARNVSKNFNYYRPWTQLCSKAKLEEKTRNGYWCCRRSWLCRI